MSRAVWGHGGHSALQRHEVECLASAGTGRFRTSLRDRRELGDSVGSGGHLMQHAEQALTTLHHVVTGLGGTSTGRDAMAGRRSRRSRGGGRRCRGHVLGYRHSQFRAPPPTPALPCMWMPMLPTAWRLCVAAATHCPGLPRAAPHTRRAHCVVQLTMMALGWVVDPRRVAFLTNARAHWAGREPGKHACWGRGAGAFHGGSTFKVKRSTWWQLATRPRGMHNPRGVELGWLQ